MNIDRLVRAIALHREYQRTSDLSLLREAAKLLREVVDDTDPAGREHGAAASLAVVLRDLGIATHDDHTQDEALDWMRVALEHPAPPEVQAVLENNLGVALRDRYDRRGCLTDLTESITLLRRSAETTDPALRAQAMDNLGLALRFRHRRIGDLADLDEAVHVHRQAVAVASDRDPERPRYLNDLASALRGLGEYRSTDELLDEAIVLHERALTALPPAAGFRRVCLHDLFTALLARHRTTGERSDLERLIEIDRDLRTFLAVRGTTPDAAELNRRVNLMLLGTASATAAVAEDLAEAVAALLRAIGLVAEEVPERSQLRANLAECLRLQHEHQLAGVTTHDVTSTYRAACRDGLVAGADSAVGAAVHWASWAERRNGTAARREAVEAYEYALEALYRLVALQLGDAYKHVRLRQLRGVPADAALACLRAAPGGPADGWAERAVAMLERGRAILLSETIDLDLARLADLAGTDHGHLAERFWTITGFLREREAAGSTPN